MPVKFLLRDKPRSKKKEGCSFYYNPLCFTTYGDFFAGSSGSECNYGYRARGGAGGAGDVSLTADGALLVSVDLKFSLKTTFSGLNVFTKSV